MSENIQVGWKKKQPKKIQNKQRKKIKKLNLT